MFDIQENLKKLPDKPGVYMHKDKFGQVIYVGKALSLKNRVRQYFQSTSKMDPKVKAMVSHIEEFEYITTNTEMEALILENNLIKKFMPKYNVLLRDDKTYPYIKVTLNEEWPRVVKTRRIINDGCKYFGPYADVAAVNQIVDLLSGAFSLKKCSARKFQDNKPCLNYHINQCKGICTGRANREEYMKGVDEIISFLNGKNKDFVNFLRQRMEAEAEAMNYERAAEYRDYVLAAESISEKQRVVLSTAGDMDAILTAGGSNANHVIVFFVRGGKLSGRESYHLSSEGEEDRKDVVAAFIKQYYSNASLIPKEILIEQEIPEQDLIEEWLAGVRGSSVKLLKPMKGEKRAFLDLARKDVIEMTKYLDDRAKAQEERNTSIARELTEFIGPKGSPGQEWRVEAYDISNTNGVDSVAGMIVFEGNRPVRRDYRRFKIKTVEGPNDYGSLQEVLYRRLKRGLANDPGFSKMPDLFLIDGGQNQVNVVEQVLSAMKVDIPVAGMVKDDKHRTRGLLYKEKEISLKDSPALLRYIGGVQEEVHRFSVDYHRGLRNRSLKKSVLDEVEGIGEKRKTALFAKFGSIEAIRNADIEEISKVEGMNRPAAEKVKKHLNNSIEK